MCGRYALTTPPSVLASLYQAVIRGGAFGPRYNIAPTQSAPVLLQSPDAGTREVVLMRWGLIPSWAKDAADGSRLINARCESAAEKPAFRHAFRRRRCIVPASGFFEWRKTSGAQARGPKQPYYITRADGQPMAFAGLWERWGGPAGDGRIDSFTILTTDADDAIRTIHDRMPLMLDDGEWQRWIDPAESGAHELAELLDRATRGRRALAVQPVSSRINSPANENPSLIEPITIREPIEDEPGGLFG